MFTLILLVFAFVFACIGASPYGDPDPRRARLISVALACFFLALILGDKLISTRIGN